MPRRPSSRPFRTIALLTVLASSLWRVEPSTRAECNTVPIAVDDATTTIFDERIDVLRNDSDAEGHLLTVSINSTTCPGSVTVDFGLVTLDPNPRLQDDCSINYTVTDELGAQASATIRVTFPKSIFADDFENGEVSAWSSCSGCT